MAGGYGAVGAGAAIASGTSFQLTLPSPIAAGDLIVIHVSTDTIAGTCSTPAGYTPFGGGELESTSIAGWLFYKWATGAEDGTQVNITRGGTTSVMTCARAYIITGLAGSGEPVVSGQRTTGSASPLSTGNNMLTGDEDFIVAFIGYGDDDIANLPQLSGGNGTWTDRDQYSTATGGDHSLQVQTSPAPGGGADLTAGSYTFSPSDPWYCFTIVFDVPSAGQSQAIGTVSTTDTAQPIAWAPKRRLVGIVSQTTSALAIAARKAKALLTATTTETAQPLGAPQKKRLLGTVQTVETAQPITGRKAQVLGIVTDTASALTITPSTGGGEQTLAITAAVETNTALAMGARKSRAVAPVTTSDIAVAFVSQKFKAVGTVTQTTASIAISSRKSRAIAPVSTSTTAMALGAVSKAKLLGIATMTTSAVLIASRKNKAIIAAVETDSAMPLTRLGQLGIVVETDTAPSFTIPAPPQSRTALDRRQRYRRNEGRINV